MTFAETRARLRQWLGGLDPDSRLFGIGFVLLLPVFWAPLAVTRILPGLDLPFHLTIADMLSKSGAPDSPYAPFYEGSLRVAPYAAHYLALVALGKVMNLLLAHKLVVAAYVAAMPLSAAALLAACGRSRIPALLAFPLAYNLTLHYGFISFALSLPVLMLLLAQTARHVQAPPERFQRTWLLCAGLAFLLFLCHLQNYLYGVGAALAFAVLAPVAWRRRLYGAATLLPSLAGLAYWHFLGPPHASPRAAKTLMEVWAILKRDRLHDLDRGTFLHDFGRRLSAIPNHAMRAFADMSEVTACRAAILAMAAYLLFGLLAWRSGNDADEKPRPRTWLAGLVAFAAALLAYLLLPHHLREFDLMTFYPRFAALVLLTALLLIPASLLRLRGFLRLVLLLPALVVCVLHGRQLIVHYRMYAAETADFVALVDETPPGGRAISVVFNRASRVMRIESVFLGMSGFYPALRPAPGSMAPLSYCGMRHMPCHNKPAAADVPDPWYPKAIRPERVVPIFDYFFVRSPPAGTDLFGNQKDRVELVRSRGEWSLYRKKTTPPSPALVAPTPAAPPSPPAAPPSPPLTGRPVGP